MGIENHRRSWYSYADGRNFIGRVAEAVGIGWNEGGLN